MKGKFLKSILLLLLLCTPQDSYAQSTQASGTINSYEYVDLGLSVMWATCNVGANSPEDYGNYYAWGEISPRPVYTSIESTTHMKDMGDIAGNPNYDVARANWGSAWRLPTKEEIEELINNCTTEWTTHNSVKGYLFTSKKNGNSIFLPAAGYYDGEYHTYVGDYGYYWSSSPDENDTNNFNAYRLRFYSGHIGIGDDFRNSGKSVRPVLDGSTTIKQQTQIASPPSNGYINGYEYVDLGLSVKWATCNVGASSPSDYGNYYAWGEIEPKSEYKKGNGTIYNENLGDIAGNPNYDAARASWGGSWRMPTREEIYELMNKCKRTWTTQGGHNGYRITGPNGNSIFLPAAGFRYGPSYIYVGEYGRYWSSSPGGSQSACNLLFDNECFGWDLFCRYDGRSVRAVTE